MQRSTSDYKILEMNDWGHMRPFGGPGHKLNSSTFGRLVNDPGIKRKLQQSRRDEIKARIISLHVRHDQLGRTGTNKTLVQSQSLVHGDTYIWWGGFHRRGKRGRGGAVY